MSRANGSWKSSNAEFVATLGIVAVIGGFFVVLTFLVLSGMNGAPARQTYNVPNGPTTGHAWKYESDANALYSAALETCHAPHVTLTVDGSGYRAIVRCAS